MTLPCPLVPGIVPSAPWEAPAVSPGDLDPELLTQAERLQRWLQAQDWGEDGTRDLLP